MTMRGDTSDRAGWRVGTGNGVDGGSGREDPFDPERYRATAAGDRCVLLKGGTILSMDRGVGDFAQGDVLIEGTRIAAVAPHIQAAAPMIDASAMIIIPGFCDPHIHAWQGNLPRIISDHRGDASDLGGLPGPTSPTQNYRVVMHETFAPHYRPEDIYVGTLMSLLVALNGGITTVCDNAHNSRSHEHSVASIEALRDAGVRGIHAFGRARAGKCDSGFPENAYRLKHEYFASDDAMHGMRLFMRGRDPLDEIKQALRIRRDLDLWMSFDTGFGNQPVVALYAEGLLDGRETINHGNFVAPEKMRAVAEHGGTVNVCPRIETQFRCGDIPFRDWRDAGLEPGISNDDPATFPINMFQEMRILYSYERAKVYRAEMRGDADAGELVTVREMLEAATMQGARNCGLADRVGSITPGKQADIVMIDTDNVQLFPKGNAYCTVVQGGDPAFVDTVFVAGALKKWRGKLLDIDLASIMRMVEQSRDHLFAAAGWPLEAIDVS